MKFFSVRPSPAMVLAVLALVFAMVGSAVAGTDGLSNKLNKAKVKKIAKKQADKRLKANVTDSHVNLADKATTADSATTAASADTAAEATGLTGPLASGKTLTGSWGTAGRKVGAGFVDESAISFPIALAAAPTAVYRAPGAAPNTDCPGTAANPQAAAGRVCFYAVLETGGTGLTFVGPGPPPNALPSKYGVVFFATGVAADTNYELDGTWAVTAP